MMRRLIFIGGGSPFMMKAVVKHFEEAEYTVISVSPDVDALDRHQRDAEIIVLFLGPGIVSDRDFQEYLRNLCVYRGKRLFLIGDGEEIGGCADILSEDVVEDIFEKPFDIGQFVSKVNLVTDDPEAGKDKQILLVDDDIDFLKMMGGFLREKYRVAIVSSGMQAITYLAGNKPDLILLDYSMPVASGPQVLEMIRSEPSTETIPVIFLTGKDDVDSIRTAAKLKPDGYFLKSTGKYVLLKRLEKFFNGDENF